MTPRQLKTLNCIKRFELKHNRRPTINELRSRLKYPGTGPVRQTIFELIALGYLRGKFKNDILAGFTAFKPIPMGGYKFMKWPDEKRWPNG